MWPFSRKKPDLLDPVELRNRLIAAAGSGSPKKLRADCQKYKVQVAQHLIQVQAHLHLLLQALILIL